jgi:copper(I)-binding protein
MKATGIKSRFGFNAVVLLVGALVLAACTSAPPNVSIEGAKAELSQAIYGEAMVVMHIRNAGGADELKGVRVDIPNAKATLHVMEGERMVRVDMVEVLGNSDLEFKMGGSHIMLQEIPKTMTAGTKFNLTLVFAKSGEKTIPLTLEGPTPMPMNTMPMEKGKGM